MKLIEIALENFRCFEFRRFNFSSGVNLVLGPNASGKTTLIEGIYLIFTGKQMRPGRPVHLVRWGWEKAQIRGELESGIELKAEIKEGKIRLFHRREEVAARFLKERYRVVSFQANEISLVAGEPSVRRRFLDGVVVSLYPHYQFVFHRYLKALRLRNSLLKEDDFDLEYMKALEKEMAHLAAKIIKKRELAREKLNPFFRKVGGKLGFKEVEIVYEESKGLSEEELEEVIMAQAEERRGIDREKGITTFGPHHHDMRVMREGVEVRYISSRGEQRLLSLGLKLALALLLKREGEEPLLLLDDPFSELDEERTQFLLNQVTQFDQSIVTSVENPLEGEELHTLWLGE